MFHFPVAASLSLALSLLFVSVCACVCVWKGWVGWEGWLLNPVARNKLTHFESRHVAATRRPAGAGRTVGARLSRRSAGSKWATLGAPRIKRNTHTHTHTHTRNEKENKRQQTERPAHSTTHTHTHTHRPTYRFISTVAIKGINKWPYGNNSVTTR